MVFLSKWILWKEGLVSIGYKEELKFIQSIAKPFNSQKWLTCNFSQYNAYIIQQTCNENTQSYQVETVVMI